MEVVDMANQLLQLARKNGIFIEFYNFKSSIEGLYMKLPDNPPIIGLSKNLFVNYAHFRSVLAHELGHHYLSNKSSPNTLFHSPNQKIVRHEEYKAWKWAANHLIPEDKLANAIGLGIRETWRLAELFEVDEEVVKIRLDHWNKFID
jgi:Zn-dependent peptidase ImmA (M78 family)